MGKPKLIRWPRLVIGVTALLFAGIIYAWSIINAPFVGVLDAAQLGINYTITIMFFCLGGFFSGLLSKKTSSSLRLIISGTLLFSGFFITANLDGSNTIALYIAYGVLAGTGVGFAYNTVIGTVNAWFPDKQGLSSGLLLMGFGLSSLTVGQIASVMGRSAAIGWRPTYIIFAISSGVVLFIAALFIKLPPAGTVFPAPKIDKNPIASSSSAVEDYTATRMLRQGSFIKLFTFIMIVAASGSAAISFALDIVTEVGAPLTLAVTSVGLLSASNGVGRFIAGWLFDVIGMRKTQIIIALVALLAPFTVAFGIITNSPFLAILGVCLCGLAYGLAPTMGSVIVAEFFGLKNFALNFSILNLLVLMPAPFAATLAGVLKDATDSFISTFIILGACAMVGFFINISIKKPQS